MSLPSTYRRLNYIESSGKQLINTKVLMTSKTLIKGKFNKLTSSGVLFGQDYMFIGDEKLYSYNSNKVGTLSLDTVIEFECKLFPNDQYFKIGDTVVASSSYASGSYTPYHSNDHAGLFCRNATLYKESLCSGRIYYWKIYQGDDLTLVRDFIPVIRHSDGQIGMLDLVHFKFYGNSGSGTFIGGPVKEVA